MKLKWIILFFASSLGLFAQTQCEETSISFLGNYRPDNLTFQSWVEGNLAYVATEEGVDILDVSDPHAPTFLNQYVPPDLGVVGSANDIYVEGDLLFISIINDTINLSVADLRDPVNPVHLINEDIPLLNRGENMAYSNGFLYVADCWDDRFAVYDFRDFDIDNPPVELVHTYILQEISSGGGGTGIVHSFRIKDERLYCATWNGGTYIYDISNIAIEAPVLIDVAPGSAIVSAQPNQDGEYLILGENRSGRGLTVLRMTEDGLGGLDFTVTDEVTFSHPNDSGIWVAEVIGNRVYSTWFEAGLRVYDLNPVTGKLEFVASYEAEFNIPIYDVVPFAGDDQIYISGRGVGFTIVDLRVGAPLLDLNSDMQTALDDLVLLVNEFGACANPNDCDGDLDDNGLVDISDLLTILPCL